MILFLFIGAALTYVSMTYGFSAALGVAFIFAIMFSASSRSTPQKKLPNQKLLLEQILNFKPEKISEKIIGSYNDKPIYEYIVCKNPVKSVSTKYEFSDIIHYNADGQITIAPKADEVYTSWGQIYKDTGEEFKQT